MLGCWPSRPPAPTSASSRGRRIADARPALARGLAAAAGAGFPAADTGRAAAESLAPARPVDPRWLREADPGARAITGTAGSFSIRQALAPQPFTAVPRMLARAAHAVAAAHRDADASAARARRRRGRRHLHRACDVPDPDRRRQHSDRPDLLPARRALQSRRSRAACDGRPWRSTICRRSTSSSSATTTTTTATSALCGGWHAASTRLLIAPLGNARLARTAGLRKVEELDWWQPARSSPVPVTATPARHFSARSPFDRNRALWSGFVLEAGGRRIYFAGDTAHADVLSRDSARVWGRSTWRCCRLAPTSRVGSCSRST